MTTPSDILRANLAQLRRTEPELVERIMQATPAQLSWQASKQGTPTAQLHDGSRTITLASRYDPLAEAEKLISTVDPQKHACIVLLGMGLGYHAAQLSRKLSNTSLIVVFEPDIALLRAVLENVDHTKWIGQPNVIIADDQMDRAGLTSRLEQYAAIVTQGTVLVHHPVTRQRHAEAVNRFSLVVTDVASFCRTHMATALVNASRTIRNLCNNLASYTAGNDTNSLYNAAQGFPAVCVGAGPSLGRNVQLLTDPEIRRKVVVVAAQTTLKPLLDRGIRPDFVTALDYHEISKRFYEGLPELPDVTLVAEPLAHASIIESFPGPVCVTQSRVLDQILGDIAKPIIHVPYGATVAHLSFYLAQHLGCDPIIMIGQDLGFSDGVYYSPGTAYHDVWAPEMGTFNTIEMMEWQRIVRHRSHLQKVKDIHGRDIYTDEQMMTYLKQFEKDFSQAPQRVIDASEGGQPKQFTTRMSLSEALAQYALRPVPHFPSQPRELDLDRLKAASRVMGRLAEQVAELRKVAGRTVPILEQMREHKRDQAKMGKLFAKLHPLQHRVNTELAGAFQIVNEINTVGAFRRARADRAIEYASDDPFEKQDRQLQRDIDNLNWLVQAADEARSIFEEALTRLHKHLDARAKEPCATAAA